MGLYVHVVDAHVDDDHSIKSCSWGKECGLKLLAHRLLVSGIMGDKLQSNCIYESLFLSPAVHRDPAGRCSQVEGDPSSFALLEILSSLCHDHKHAQWSQADAQAIEGIVGTRQSCRRWKSWLWVSWLSSLAQAKALSSVTLITEELAQHERSETS